MPITHLPRLFCASLLILFSLGSAFANEPQPTSVSLFNRPITALRVPAGTALPKSDGDLSDPPTASRPAEPKPARQPTQKSVCRARESDRRFRSF